MGYAAFTSSVSNAIATDSSATSLPSDFMSVPVILVGQALCSVHTIFGAPVSSSRLMTTARREMMFILISENQVQNLASLTKMPLRMVTLATLPRPGILIGENTLLSPWRYSITLVSASSPVTSENLTSLSSPSWTEK